MAPQQIADIESLFIELTERWFEAEYQNGVRTHQRTGVFTAALTVWLMIAQKTLSADTLSGVLEVLHRSDPARGVLSWNTRSKKVRLGTVSSNPGALCQARQRLPLAKVEALADMIAERLAQEHADTGRWYGYRTYLMDGSTIALPNSDALRAAYPATSNTKALFPEARLVVAHDLVTGVAVRPSYGTIHDSEQRLSQEVFERLPKGSLVVGDRNFGVFSTAWGATVQGHLVLVRLTKERAQKIVGSASALGGVHHVQWTPSKKDRKTLPTLPEEAQLTGRIFSATMHAPGFRAETLYFFSTVPEVAVEELVTLYGKRWCVEQDIRTIKHSVGLEMILARSPDVVHKELILGVVAYNLLRAVIARAARCLGLCPRDLSFTRARDFCVTLAMKLVHAKSAQERHAAFERFLTALYQMRHPQRRNTRLEPRKVVRRKTRFPFMGQDRAQEKAQILQRLAA